MCEASLGVRSLLGTELPRGVHSGAALWLSQSPLSEDHTLNRISPTPAETAHNRVRQIYVLRLQNQCKSHVHYPFGHFLSQLTMQVPLVLRMEESLEQFGNPTVAGKFDTSVWGSAGAVGTTLQCNLAGRHRR